MTETDIDREVLARWCAEQTECPVVAPLTLEDLLALPREAAAEQLQMREDVIHNLTAYPLTHCWEPDIWRRIDLEVARKRLAFPGRVLEVFITGGMRPGKSFSCARRMVAHWLYTERACVFGLADTQATSRTLQQQPVERFLPEEVSPASGKHKTTKHDRYKFSGGHFTNDEFSLRVPVSDETGRKFMGGGDFKFRFFNQELSTFQGFAVSAAWSDELVPLDRVKTLFERMGTRAQDTRAADHVYRIQQAVKILEGGKRLPVPLLGALYHGVHLVSFTPYLGWNETVNYFLHGAEKRDMEIAPELDGRTGVRDPRVPRFAQPVRQTALVAYIHTRDNRIKPDTNLLEEMKDPSRKEKEIRLKLYGDVDRDVSRVFHSFGESNLCDWRDIPRRNASIYEVIDFGKAKPPALQWWVVDSLSRRWLAQEWPCPSIPVQIGGRMSTPGAWAVPSETNRLNGDEGPAYKLQLRWDSARIVREIWAMRARLMQKMAETGEPWEGAADTAKRTWTKPLSDAGAELAGPFALPRMTIPDPRGMQETVEGTSLELKYYQCENGIIFQPWKDADGKPIVNAPSDDDGIRFILDALAKDVQGSPLVRINRECENTRFMLTNFTVPPFKDGPQRKDEVCIEWFDLQKYLEAWEPRHFERAGWQNRADQRWP